MKLKLFIALLFLTGSAFAQLIPIKEESGFLSSSNSAGSLFTPAGDAFSISSQTSFPARISLNLQGSFSAPPATVETQHLGVGARGVVLNPVAKASMSGTNAPSLSAVLDLANLSDVSRAQSDSSLINHDQEVFALITASTVP